VESEIGAEFVDAINGSDRSREVELQLVEVENQAADYLTLTHILVEDEFAEPFEISAGVVIPAGRYTYDHTCVSLYTGEQRVLATESSICNGGFYDGQIFTFETKTTWRPSAHLKVTLGGEYNDVDLPEGDFITRLARLNFDIALNTAWSWENFVQYDNVSDTVGLNSILRWIPRAGQETVRPVTTTWVVELRSRIISRAAASSAGLPTDMSPNATTVSAARVTSSGNRLATSAALAWARKPASGMGIIRPR